MKKLMIAAAAAAMIGGAYAEIENDLTHYSDAAYTISVKGKGQCIYQAKDKKVNKTITIAKDVIKYLNYDQDAVYAALTNDYESALWEYNSVTNKKFSTVTIKTPCGESVLFTNKISFTGMKQQWKEKLESATRDFLTIVKDGKDISYAVYVDKDNKKYVALASALVDIQDFNKIAGKKVAAALNLKTYGLDINCAGAGSWKAVKVTNKDKSYDYSWYINTITGNCIANVEENGWYTYGTFNLAFSSKYTKLLNEKSATEALTQWAKDKKATIDVK